MILDKVNYPEDLKCLKDDEKVILAEEIREKIIDTVSETGGHLASNLGIVELTIAIHSIFNTPIDKVIWDVGHQTYVHKILTGRKNKMDILTLTILAQYRLVKVIKLFRGIIVRTEVFTDMTECAKTLSE